MNFFASLARDAYSSPYALALTLILISLTYYISPDAAAIETIETKIPAPSPPSSLAEPAVAEKPVQQQQQQVEVKQQPPSGPGLRPPKSPESKRTRTQENPPVPPRSPTPVASQANTIEGELSPLMAVPHALVYGITLGNINLFTNNGRVENEQTNQN